MDTRRILITGANGLLGQSLVRRLHPLNEVELFPTSRNDEPRFSIDIRYNSLDITNFEKVTQLLRDIHPDVVVNCAAMTQVDHCERQKDQCWDVNASAVEHLAGECQKRNTHLVQLSTDFVFDGYSGPYREEDRPSPVNYYGRSKLQSERIIREQLDRQWSIARTILVYGTGKNLGRSNIAQWVVRELQDGKPVTIVTDQWRTPTYVEDLSDGVARLALQRPTGIFHLSGREYLSVYSFARRLADAFDLDPSLVRPTTSQKLDQEAARPSRTGFFLAKAQRLLSYEPQPLDTALTHFRQQLDQLESATAAE